MVRGLLESLEGLLPVAERLGVSRAFVSRALAMHKRGLESAS